MKAKILLPVTALLLVGGFLLAWHMTHRPTPKPQGYTLPVTLKSQLAFKAYVPAGDYFIVPNTVKYDNKQSLLSMKVGRMSKPIVVLTEQPYPDTLIYDKLVGTMNAARQVGNSLGQATVTHPKSAPGKEVVVVQADSTLLFASSDVQQNDGDWRAMLNSLQEYH